MCLHIKENAYATAKAATPDTAAWGLGSVNQATNDCLGTHRAALDVTRVCVCLFGSRCGVAANRKVAAIQLIRYEHPSKIATQLGHN